MIEQWIKWMEIGKQCGCHQMPERSFFICGYQFPLCARCTGMLIGETIAYISILFKKIISPFVAVLLLLTMGADWFIQFINIRESTNIRRFITGIMGGIGITYCLIHCVLIIIKTIKHR